MSDIPQARNVITMILQTCNLDAVTRRYLHKALGLNDAREARPPR